MDRVNHICLRATYSEWINTKLIDAICELAEDTTDSMDQELTALLHLMNESVMADILWLKRFAENIPLLSDMFSEIDLKLVTDDKQSNLHPLKLSHIRQSLDQMITRWSSSVSVHDLDSILQYICTGGILQKKNFFTAIMHFFNYQAFVREKMISQLIMKKINFHVTDLLVPHACQLEI